MLNGRAQISRQGDAATSDCFLSCGAGISFAAESHAFDTSDRVVAFTVAVSYGCLCGFCGRAEHPTSCRRKETKLVSRIGHQSILIPN